MSDSEPFALITTSSHHKVFDDYEELNSGHGYDANTSLQAALRRQYPGLALTVTLASNSTSPQSSVFASPLIGFQYPSFNLLPVARLLPTLTSPMNPSSAFDTSLLGTAAAGFLTSLSMGARLQNTIINGATSTSSYTLSRLASIRYSTYSRNLPREKM